MIITKELILAAQAGNEEAVIEIVDKCLPSIKRIAHKYITNQNEIEDFIQEGSIMILDCISRYNPNSHYSFNTYVTNSFIKKLVRILKRKPTDDITYSYQEVCDEQENIEETSLDEIDMENSSYEEITSCDQDTLEVANAISHIEHEKDLLREELKHIMRRALNEAHLRITERLVIESLYGIDRESRNPKELADAFTTSEKNISYIKRRALNKLRGTPSMKNYPHK